MSIDLGRTWVGVGTKLGGSLGVAGFETMDGIVTNMGYTQWVTPISISSFRLGPGLGGGAGLVAILVFNCNNIYDLHDTENSDWSVNFSLSGKWSSILKGLQKYKFFSALSKLMDNAITPGEMTSIRNSLSYLYTEADIIGMDDLPKTVTLDIPAAGYGAEISAFYTYGVITIGEPTTSGSGKADYDGGGSGSGPGT